MTWTDKTAFTGEAAAFAGELHDKLAALPSLALSTLDSESTALFVVDMVEGFARQGAMASPRVEALIAPIAALAGRCEAAGIPVVAFADTHAPDSLELQAYPPHCLRGTEEARLCPEIAAAAPKHTVLEKNSTNGFLEPVFELWRREQATATTYLVTGDCTDICIQQFAVAAKAWHNTRNLPLRVIVPLSLVDTFDADGHPADLLGVLSLMTMQSGGVERVRDIV